MLEFQRNRIGNYTRFLLYQKAVYEITIPARRAICDPTWIALFNLTLVATLNTDTTPLMFVNALMKGML